MTEFKWTELDLDDDPRMLVGKRKASKRFEVNQVDLHSELFPEIREICRGALEDLDQRDAKAYSPFASLTTDEYFLIEIGDLPLREDKRKKGADAFEPAAALSLIADTDGFRSLSAAEIREAAPTMYAFSFKTDDGYVGFIKNSSPRRRVGPGIRFLRYEDTLRRLESPDLAIEDSIDVVVTPSDVVILRLSAFDTLFGDVGLVFQSVPRNVSGLASSLNRSLPLSAASVEALEGRCSRRILDARRLDHIVTNRASVLAKLSAAELRALLVKRGLNAVVKRKGLHLTADTVSEFLDAVEGRLFEDDLTGEQRRADSYSSR